MNLFNLLCIVGVFGVFGLVWTLRVKGLTTLLRIAGPFLFRPPAPQQVIANEQQVCTDKQFAGDPRRVSATPATGSVLSPGEGPTSTGITTIPTQEIEQLNATLQELCKLVQALMSQVARLNHLLVEGRTTGPLKNGEMLLQQPNDKVDDITRKTNDTHHIINQGARSTDIIPAEAGVARLNHYNEHSSKELDAPTGNRTPDNAHRTTGSKDNPISTKEEKLHRPASPFERKSDGSFVAEAEELASALNVLVEQASCLFAEELRYRELPISSKESEDVLNELVCYIGPWLCNKLRIKPNTEHYRLMITRLVLQSGMVNVCGHITEHGFPLFDGATLSRTHSDPGPGQAEKAQSPTHTTTSQNGGFEINRKHLARIALRLITAVGGSLESGGALLPRHSDVLDEIVKTSLALHKTVSEAATSMELVTYTIPCNTDFDHSQMQDTEEDGSETRHIAQDTVVCTLEMGLRYRKSGSEEDWGIAMKTKVVLASTLKE